MRLVHLMVCAVIAASSMATAFYIPAVAPIGYKQDDDVGILVNGLHSNTGILPFGYYELPFCKPASVETRHETLGEILMGDKIETSAYTFTMNRDVKCRQLACQEGERDMNNQKLAKLEKFIEDNYRGYLVLDNLPVFNNGSLVYGGRCKDRTISDSFEWLRGYALGVTKKCSGGSTLINNHIHFRIQVHKPTETDFWVVGFTATPYSIDYGDTVNDVCGADKFDLASLIQNPLTTDAAKTKKIIWTYGVSWIEEPGIKWASRWDSYLHTSFADTNNRIHWFSITNSLLIVLCLLAATFLVLVRSLRKDFAHYAAILAAMESGETAQEEGGWKMVHADAMRPPERINDLIVFVSSGIQLAGMGGLTLFFALLGFLSPANRGGLLTALILLYVVQAFVAGYFCARMLKLFSEKSWLTVTYTAIAIPSVGFGVLLIANITSAHAHASSAVRFVTLLAMLGLWLGISVPLVVLGAAFGFQVHVEKPLGGASRNDAEPRPIPEQPPALSDWFCILIPGLVPFGALFLELRFILASLWQGMVYYVFGFLSIVFVLWFLCAALMTVVIVYYRLSFENYQWWWISFLSPGGCGLHIFGYFTYYYFTQLEIRSTDATLVYFLTMGLVAIAYALVAGAIGFVSSYVFIRKIYSTIKMD